MDFTDEGKIQATRGLYRLFCMNYYTHLETKVEDVKYFLDNGAYLTGFLTRKGLPIHYAIFYQCSPTIIQLLKEYGGIDMNYKVMYSEWFDVKGAAWIQKHIYRYHTILNILLIYYHRSIGSGQPENDIIDKLIKEKQIHKTKFRVKQMKRIHEIVLGKIVEYCRILDIHIDELKSMKETLPNNLKVHDNIPITHEYLCCWNFIKNQQRLDENKKQWCPYIYKKSESGEELYEKNPDFFEVYE